MNVNEIQLRDLKLSNRALWALDRADVRTLSQLAVKFSHGLRAMRGIGVVTFRECRKLLEEHGIPETPKEPESLEDGLWEREVLKAIWLASHLVDKCKSCRIDPQKILEVVYEKKRESAD